MTLIENWIWKENLNALLDELSMLARTDLDQDVRRVIIDDIAQSDGDASPERWAAHDFSNDVTAKFAIDQGTDVLRVRVSLPHHLAERARSLLAVMQTYHLRKRN